MTDIEIQERRAHPRLELEVPVPLQGGYGAVFLRNISANGALLQSSEPIEPMTRLAVHLELDEEEFELDCTGVVVRCDPNVYGRYDVGVYFHDLSDIRRLELEALINERVRNS